MSALYYCPSCNEKKIMLVVDRVRAAGFDGFMLGFILASVFGVFGAIVGSVVLMFSFGMIVYSLISKSRAASCSHCGFEFNMPPPLIAGSSIKAGEMVYKGSDEKIYGSTGMKKYEQQEKSKN